MNRFQFLLSTSMLACLAAASQPAFAEDTSAEASVQDAQDAAALEAASASDQPATDGQGVPVIMVTAERRTGDVQNTAAAVSVRSGSDLATQGKFSTRQILEDVPGVVAVENSSINPGSADVQGNNIRIRGITAGAGAGAAMQISGAPPTAVYVDGVYEGVGGVYDIDRVEVLRGPQGTLYGRSATAGVVAFHTRNPVLDEVEGNASVEFGSYDLQHYTGAINLPLGSNIALRVSGDYRDQGKGYFGEGDRGKRERINGRAKLLWEPTDDLSFLLGIAYEEDNAFSGGADTKSTQAGVETTTVSPFFPAHKTQQQYWAEANWDVGGAVITYQGALRKWEQHDLYLQSPNFIGSGLRLMQILETPTNRFHTQELRIASDGDSALTWQGGVFYYENKLKTTNRNFLADNNSNEIVLQLLTDDDKRIENLGFFAEATYAVTPALRLTLGARYDDTDITVSEFSFENQWSLCGTNIQFIAQRQLPPGATCTGPGQASVPPRPGVSIEDQPFTFHNFNYKARIEYDVTERNLLYASVSTGFRPGDAGIARNQLNILDAEKLTSIEVGSKNRFLDNTLQLNLAGFYYIYEGFQTSYQPQTCLPGPPGAPPPPPGPPCTPYADNPADYAGISTVRVTVPARNLGLELESIYQPTDNDQFSLSYSYLQSRWANKPAAFAAAQPETKRAMIPHTVIAAYQHTFELPGGSSIVGRIDGKYESAHLTTNLHADLLVFNYDRFFRVGDRLIGNAQVTWVSPGGNYSLTGYVRNFTNEDYRNYGFNPDLNALYVNYVDPRTFGVVASARF